MGFFLTVYAAFANLSVKLQDLLHEMDANSHCQKKNK